MKKLIDCATVEVGHVFKGKATTDDVDASTKLVQINDLQGYSINDVEELSLANLEGAKPKILLTGGEILFKLKGKRLHAALYLPDAAVDVTTANNIAIIEPRAELKPEYLLWYLNSPLAENQLKNMQVGSTIPSISRKRLEALDVPIVSMARQQAIGKAYKNWCKQERLLKEMLNIGGSVMNAFCLKTVRQESDE